MCDLSITNSSATSKAGISTLSVETVEDAWLAIKSVDDALNQINGARVFAVEQILAQYPAALTDVTTQQQIVIVLQPDTLQFAAEGADITPLITTSLNAKVPSVQIVPPADYRPSRNAAAIFQEIQQTLLTAQIIQQQNAAQQQQQAAPAGR